MPTVNVSLTKNLRKEVAELVARGEVSTFSEAVHVGLSMLVKAKQLQRWNRRLWQEYESGLLQRNPRTNFLFSYQFQKDVNKFVKTKDRELKRGLYAALRKVSKEGHFEKLRKTELANYFLLDFMFHGDLWRVLIRKQRTELIACRLNLAAEFFI